MKTNTCMPRFRTNAAAFSRKNRHVGQMSLVDRLRDAVFRLIMISALSKSSLGQEENNNAGDYHRAEANCYRLPQPHHSEAVADCIEFIKKSATVEDSCDSSCDGEVNFPMPIM